MGGANIDVGNNYVQSALNLAQKMLWSILEKYYAGLDNYKSK